VQQLEVHYVPYMYEQGMAVVLQCRGQAVSGCTMGAVVLLKRDSTCHWIRWLPNEPVTGSQTGDVPVV
jgi:hypothetical protein